MFVLSRKEIIKYLHFVYLLYLRQSQTGFHMARFFDNLHFKFRLKNDYFIINVLMIDVSVQLMYGEPLRVKG